ncbi:histone deacetylase domain-domain-containing protein [Leucosporidium creatinivorum]|uniref:Histone deacetylase domain-domain-containing protein n=1 Tax=Leucosporidium creatinivorum TaxID=106004 RepID=A0A1Y2ERD2_9BASI|nr:histone deacetylase domain-domain-containing protein [Leucosporidium creatinivorum]
MASPGDQATPAAPASSSILDDDLSATLDALSLTQQHTSPPSATPLPPPIPLRQAVPNTLSEELSPERERTSSSNPPLKSSFESNSSSPFPVTPTDPNLVKPVISPAPPSRRTCVILQDACLQHRYARNDDIGTIVERPERIRAIKTGVAAAWARLEARNVAHGGTRWEGPQAGQQASKDAEAELESMMSGLGPSIHSPLAERSPTPPPAAPRPASPPLPTSSRPIQTPSTSPSKQPPPSAPFSAPPKLPSRPPPLDPTLPWPQQLSSLCKNASAAILDPPYSEIPPHLPQGDLYLTEGSEEAILGALGAVCEGVDKVVEGSRTGGLGYDRAFVAIRPPGHHCCESQPMGFCFVNNVAVAAAHAHQRHGIDRVVILDIDLHHGNGTQDIVWRINKEAQRAAAAMSSSPRKGSPKKPSPPRRDLQIFYGSLHDIFSYPCEDGDEAMVHAASLNLAGGHSQWISNVHLESFDEEAEFHERLYPKYRDGLLGAAGEFCRQTATTGEEDLSGDKTLVIVSAGFDASQHESAGMSRHRRNVPTSFFHRFSREICRFANEYSSGKVLAVLEGGYSDRALSSGALATMVGLTESPRLLEKTFLVEDGDEMGWWSESNLGRLERACKKPRRGKIAPTSTAPSNLANSAGDEPWLPRAVEIFSLIEGAEVAPKPPKEKQEPTRWMQLRERRPRGAATSSEVTPQSSPSKSVKTARSGVEIEEGVAEPSALAAAAREQREEEEGEEIKGEKSSGEMQQAPAPKIRFTFKQGGL